MMQLSLKFKCQNRYNVPSLFVTTFVTTDGECHDAAQKQSVAALSDKETGAIWFESKSDGEPTPSELPCDYSRF